VVVLLDERHLREVHRNEVLAEVETTLVAEMKRHPTWVAIAALSDELVPILAPSRDVTAVQDAFVRARGRALGDAGLIEQQRMKSNELRDLLRSLADRGSAYRMGQSNKTGVLNRLQTYGMDVAQDTRETMGLVGSLVDALAFVPGRKAVLMISDGLPRHPLGSVSETLYDRVGGGSRQLSGDDMMASGSRIGINDRNNRPSGSDRVDQSSRPQAQQDDGGVLEFQRAVAELDCGDVFDRVAALANTHRATFYPLKPPVRDSSMSGLGERSGERDSISRLSDRWSGLRGLASATGGIAFDGENGVGRFLQQTREDLAAYYALSFLPPDGMSDSGIRELVLRVRGRQNRLRYRASFIPLALEQRLSSQAWGTLLFGWQDNPHELLLETRSGELQGDFHGVDLLFSLPIGKLELVGDGAVSAGNYRVVMQLVGENGVRLEPKHLAFQVSVPEGEMEAASDQYFAVRSSIHVEAGIYQMAVGLWEENTGRSTFIIREIRAGVAEDEA